MLCRLCRVCDVVESPIGHVTVNTLANAKLRRENVALETCDSGQVRAQRIETTAHLGDPMQAIRRESADRTSCDVTNQHGLTDGVRADNFDAERTRFGLSGRVC